MGSATRTGNNAAKSARLRGFCIGIQGVRHTMGGDNPGLVGNTELIQYRNCMLHDIPV